jgi:hypothetical protein
VLLAALAIAGFAVRRRGARAAGVAAMALAIVIGWALTTQPPPASAAGAAPRVHAEISDRDLFGRSVSQDRPALVSTPVRPAGGAIIPARIRVPAAGIDAPVEQVGVRADGTMDVPGNIWDAGWLREGTLPGAPGHAVIDGHLDSTRGPAVFAKLNQLMPGDRIFVSDTDGNQLEFVVSALNSYPVADFPKQEVFGGGGTPELKLVTCDGVYSTKTHTYSRRLVVTATLASSA